MGTLGCLLLFTPVWHGHTHPARAMGGLILFSKNLALLSPPTDYTLCSPWMGTNVISRERALSDGHDLYTI